MLQICIILLTTTCSGVQESKLTDFTVHEKFRSINNVHIKFLTDHLKNLPLDMCTPKLR